MNSQCLDYHNKAQGLISPHSDILLVCVCVCVSEHSTLMSSEGLGKYLCDSPRKEVPNQEGVEEGEAFS